MVYGPARQESVGMTKPLGHKNYGSIPHLSGSRLGPADHSCNAGHAKIATEKVRNKNDFVIVTEKLDGSNVGIARIDNQIVPLSRAGYRAETSPYEQHHIFARWVLRQLPRFAAVLNDGERLVGEWMAQAHGTRYELAGEPFYAFDLMTGHKRMPYEQFLSQIRPGDIQTPKCIHNDNAHLSIEEAMAKLGGDRGFSTFPNGPRTWGFHGALEPAEGAVWRVETDRPTGKKGEKRRVVNFLVKYVRPDKVDGKYLSDVSGNEDVWNWTGDSHRADFNER